MVRCAPGRSSPPLRSSTTRSLSSGGLRPPDPLTPSLAGAPSIPAPRRWLVRVAHSLPPGLPPYHIPLHRRSRGPLRSPLRAGGSFALLTRCHQDCHPPIPLHRRSRGPLRSPLRANLRPRFWRRLPAGALAKAGPCSPAEGSGWQAGGSFACSLAPTRTATLTTSPYTVARGGPPPSHDPLTPSLAGALRGGSFAPLTRCTRTASTPDQRPPVAAAPVACDSMNLRTASISSRPSSSAASL